MTLRDSCPLRQRFHDAIVILLLHPLTRLLQEFPMAAKVRLTTVLLPLVACFSMSAYSADTGTSEHGPSKGIIIVPVIPLDEEEAQGYGEPGSPNGMDELRASRKTPQLRDPSRGMYDPETEREGDSRSTGQLSRDRLDLEGRRSRSLEELASPLRERRNIDRSRGRLREPEERIYGTPSLKDRLSVPDSRSDYRIESTRDLRQQYIEESGSSDYRVYSTRPREPARVPGEPYGSPSHWRP
jgi:hypothetical protein